VSIDPFYKAYAETNLASLHYVTFVEPLAALSTEKLSFDSEQFTKNFMKIVIEGERNYPFMLLEEHFSAVVLLYKKKYGVQFEDLSNEVLEFFSEP
jgi:hypothetical protein